MSQTKITIVEFCFDHMKVTLSTFLIHNERSREKKYIFICKNIDTKMYNIFYTNILMKISTQIFNRRFISTRLVEKNISAINLLSVRSSFCQLQLSTISLGLCRKCVSRIRVGEELRDGVFQLLDDLPEGDPILGILLTTGFQNDFQEIRTSSRSTKLGRSRRNQGGNL